jgi:glutathione peroxidase-family protein
MRGRRVERRFGWDCHGLPAEMEAEKRLGEGAVPQWNFHKILLGPDLQPIAAFPSAVTPQDPALVSAIEGALAG